MKPWKPACGSSVSERWHPYRLVDERDPENRVQKNFLYEGGISSFVEFLHKRKSLEVIHPDIIHVKGALTDGSAEAEVAMQL